MKIIICGSITAAQEIIKLQKQLEEAGHSVEIPEGVRNPTLRRRTEISNIEKAGDKIKYDLIRNYFEKIKNHDVVVVVNPQKKGITGYIGGNTLIEMAFAHVLKKPLYCLYSLPELSYSPEILAMQPIVLNGDVSDLLNLK